jgi:hypothetical protein
MLKTYITYAPANQIFVDRLEADLKARGFETWVDRSFMTSRGGPGFTAEIRQAIEQAQVVMLIATPMAVASQDVRTELDRAIRAGRLILPLTLQPCDLPFNLGSIQWIDFQGSYPTALKNLLFICALVSVPAPYPGTPMPSRPTLPRPPEDPEQLFNLGVNAKANQDIERTAALWGRALEIDPGFQAGYLSGELSRMLPQLTTARIRRLYDQIDRSRAQGAWEVEKGAWLALHDLGGPQEQRRVQDGLAIVDQHIQFRWLYQNARQAVEQGNVLMAVEHLRMLYRDAPYFGDPIRLRDRVLTLDPYQQIPQPRPLPKLGGGPAPVGDSSSAVRRRVVDVGDMIAGRPPSQPNPGIGGGGVIDPRSNELPDLVTSIGKNIIVYTAVGLSFLFFTGLVGVITVLIIPSNELAGLIGIIGGVLAAIGVDNRMRQQLNIPKKPKRRR